MTTLRIEVCCVQKPHEAPAPHQIVCPECHGSGRVAGMDCTMLPVFKFCSWSASARSCYRCAGTGWVFA